MSTLIPFATLFLLPFFAPTIHAIVGSTYQLDTHISGQTFFDSFDFFTVSLFFSLPTTEQNLPLPNPRCFHLTSPPIL
jgi:hypothetical protein